MSYTKDEKIFTLTSIIRQQWKLGNYLIAKHISTIHQSDSDTLGKLGQPQ